MRGFRTRFNKFGTVRQNEILGGIESTYGTTLTTGDPVALTGGFLVKATIGSQNISGIFAGVKWKDASGYNHTSASWIAGTVGTEITPAYVPVDDSNVLEIEADGVLPQTALGQYINWAAGTPNLLSGQSGAVVAVATLNAASTGRDLRIVGIINGNTGPDGLFNLWGVNPTTVLVTPLRAGDAFVA